MLRGHAEVRAGGWGGSTDVGARRDEGACEGESNEEAPGGVVNGAAGGRGVSRGGDGALRPGQGMAWLAQESTGCEGRRGQGAGGW